MKPFGKKSEDLAAMDSLMSEDLAEEGEDSSEPKGDPEATLAKLESELSRLRQQLGC